MSPRLDLVIGCNGAGKTTLITEHLVPILRTPFVNADEIARQRWPDAPAEHAYEAAKVAADTRTALIKLDRSFIAETVFSHPSKLDLIDDAHDHGFRVVVHVVMVPEDYAVERVRLRVASGGHPVPVDKIRQRYRRVWPLAVQAIRRCDQATVYDNRGRRTRILARFFDGVPTSPPDWPDWTPHDFSEAWPAHISI
ncbi:zeta toxin family protein [Gordonia sp. CPCC 206044]|uniref:zeta toxin family protein n=1 Tax=Gordonia sp. CPCC 206044 TaxID=3140793 RepID=UPI003AF408F9